MIGCGLHEKHRWSTRRDADRLRTVLSQEGYAHCVNAADTTHLEVDLYAHLPDEATIQYEGILAGLVPAELPESDPLTIVWSVDETIPMGKYSYGVHVSDTSGQLVMQFDEGLPNAGDVCTSVSLDWQSLPDGIYEVNLLVYDWQTGERLNGIDDSDQFLVGRIER